jgi:predicted transcriptional regulator
MIGRLFTDGLDRRDKLQIFADIIKVSSKETKMTRILRLANVQYNTFIECIEKLCQAGLLKRVTPIEDTKSSNDMRTKCVYKATDTGIKWSKLVDEIYQILEELE